jgi:hypothetical protein
MNQEPMSHKANKNDQDKRKDRRGGFYFKDNNSYVSVTTVPKIIDKPAIRYWYGREIYLAMVVNPYLNEQEAMAVPYKVSDKAKDRGSTIHSLVEAYKKSGAVIETLPSHLIGYAKAFYSWINSNEINIKDSEKTVFNEDYMYAGTLDLLADVNGIEYLIDIKTGKDIYPEAILQLSAYNEALGGKRKLGVLLLKEDGGYKFETVEPDFESFLHCKALWEWANKDLILKIGYKGGKK